jgi:hypothetical protein
MTLCLGRSASRSLLLLPVSAALLLGACASPDNNDATQVSDLTGNITGIVQDTRGHGIAGATISYAGAAGDGKTLQVTSASDGSFSMPGVIVSGVSSIGANDVNGPITLVVTPPAATSTAAYLGATVNATPTAQSGSSVGGGTVFVDGFNVGVGIIKLPQLASSVSGVLRDASTGVAIGSARVSLNFIGVEPIASDATAGVATSYDAASIAATSDSSGNFSFPSAYNDSCLQFVVTNYMIDSVAGSAPPCPTAGAATDPNTINLRTSDANSPVLLANVTVSVPTSSDTVPPTVASVDGVIDPTQSQAALESSVTTTFTVHFSETMLAGALNTGNAYVVLGASPNQTSAALTSAALTGSTATIVLASALPASTPVALHISREALKDSAGNGIADAANLAYDSLTSQELVLSFISFGSANTTASAATTAQVSKQAITNDLAYITTDALLDTVDNASDIRAARTPANTTTAYGTTPAIEQVNSNAAVTALNALLAVVAPGDTRTVQPGLGRVTVNAPSEGSASDYVVWVERGGVKQDALFFPVATSGGDPQNTAFIANSGATYVITPAGATQFDLLIRSRVPGSYTLQAGDVFHVTSRNASGVLGGTSQATFADIGRPTVALQLLDQIVAGSANPPTGGSGGVSSGGSAATPAIVQLSITPQAADVNDMTTGFASDNWRGANELQGLSHTELTTTTFATGLSNGTRAVGDADGTAAFIGNTSLNLGIAITEPATATGTLPTSSGVTTTLSAPAVQNNSINEDSSVSNLFVINVANIFTLAANAAANATIDISNSISDLNNTKPDAGTRAFVQLRDMMPPLITLGFYDGTNFTFRFNEAVQPTGTIVFNGCASAVSLSNASVVQVDAATFQFPGTLVASLASCFPLPAYAEAAYTSANLGSLFPSGSTPNPTPPHGAVTYSDVPDKTGNTWTSWTAQGLGIGAPYFAIANLTPTP